jgi:hypothetical protein
MLEVRILPMNLLLSKYVTILLVINKKFICLEVVLTERILTLVLHVREFSIVVLVTSS